ncbi:MAG: acetyl-CoA carboxylase, carboxyltransferase subunit beta [bacterium]|nr:acetyl-CoA carboxylase, carboxyltransferase subunit beta [bacterium]
MEKKWYERDDENRIPDKVQSENMVEGQWIKCPDCEKITYIEELEKNLYICPKCSYHLNIDARKRIGFLLDENSFEEIDQDITASDPLQFLDTDGSYKDRIGKYMRKTGLNEAIVTGKGKLDKKDVCIGVLDFNFSGGSMGSVVGEKVTRMVERAVNERMPVIIVSSSGGARMQEGIFSLMQMAKTSAALGLLSKNKLSFISVLTHPTTGGVTASFAMLGDVIIAEPNALIGFAGPRVIEQTIKQKLPRGFQRSEFQLEHGLIDMVVNRKDLKKTLSSLLGYLS